MAAFIMFMMNDEHALGSFSNCGHANTDGLIITQLCMSVCACLPGPTHGECCVLLQRRGVQYDYLESLKLNLILHNQSVSSPDG